MRLPRQATGLEFVPPPNPDVSIVVPVHGKWQFTRRCLESLALTQGPYTFEIIVVDDASPDRTAEYLALIPGVRVVRLQTNVGYVKACNVGIKHARGRHVVLLNNDTRVHEGWLVPLVLTVEEPGVGLVGARLVYPDDVLQEAGGLVFSDGSAWNYGRYKERESGEFLYRRDVDYCSGACIILPRELLSELGGLDENLAPAYYDDTDLAFAVRERGLRVVYEPRSLVYHDEGVSHGTDESTGLKAYQEVNRAKFVTKWAHRLVDQPAPGGGVAWAARRRQGEQLVIVIDHYVPRPDEDSGSVRMMALLITLRRLGYAVMFIPADAARVEPWSGVLGAHGVEVAYGNYALEVLPELADHTAAVIVSRVSVAARFMLEVARLLPGVPTIFDTVDLHFLRTQRRAELDGRPLGLAERLERGLELSFINACDLTLVVSTFEQELLSRLAPGAAVSLLPNVHAVRQDTASPEGRDSIVFVGSFAHPPNVDAVRWLIEEIAPQLRERDPLVSIRIVGKNPPEELVASAPDGVEFLGWVPDLEPVYARARVALAPLRYGAGVKGKIGEAMALGVPVVMTSVGAEGMQLRHDEHAWIADDAAAFTHGIVELLRDDEMWRRYSATAAAHISAVLGQEAFESNLARAIDLAVTRSRPGAPPALDDDENLAPVLLPEDPVSLERVSAPDERPSPRESAP